MASARLTSESRAAAVEPARIAAVIGGLFERVVERDPGGRAAAPGQVRALFAQLDILERAGAGDRIGIVAEVDDRTLSGKDRTGGIAGDDRAGDAAGALVAERLRWPD